MICDNSNNFVGANKELRKAFQVMDHNQISQYLQIHGANWITWIRNLPTASQIDGVWERKMRTTRNLFNALLKTHERSLNNGALQALLIEVEAIVNSWPMTSETINNVQSHVQLPPSNDEVKNYYLSTWKLRISRCLLLQTLEKNTTYSKWILGMMAQGVHSDIIITKIEQKERKETLLLWNPIPIENLGQLLT